MLALATRVLTSPAPLCSLQRYVPREPTSTALYQLVSEQRATFAQVADADGGVPSFVSDSFERFLRCGVLGHGFARYGCGACGYDHLVALSCKARCLTCRCASGC